MSDPAFRSELLGTEHALRFWYLDEASATLASASSPPWWNVLSPLGVDLGVWRLPSTLPRSVPSPDLVNPYDVSVTAFGLSVKSDPLLSGEMKEGPLRPYLGVGPALFVTSLADIGLRGTRGPFDLSSIPVGSADRTTAVLGLQAQAGLKYHLSRAWSVFGEYRLTQPAFGLSGVDSDPGKALGVHRFQGGLSIEFR